jgi:Putative auto-transporter adhesin, head GIN domain
VLDGNLVNLASSHVEGVRASANARPECSQRCPPTGGAAHLVDMRLARYALPLFAAVLCKAALAAPLATETRSVGDFHAIELDSSTPLAIDVRVGPAIRVDVSADADIITRVETRVQNGNLVVGTHTHDKLHPQNKIRVTITVPHLDALAITGIGAIDATGVSSPSFAAAIGGTGSIKLAGASDGAAYKIGGTGEIDAKNLTLKTATVAMAGTGHLALTASDAVTIAVDGVGDVDVFGHPTSVTKSVTGMGHVELH